MFHVQFWKSKIQNLYFLVGFDGRKKITAESDHPMDLSTEIQTRKCWQKIAPKKLSWGAIWGVGGKFGISEFWISG